MSSGNPPPRPLRIGLIANNDRTVSDLLNYFANVGSHARWLTNLAEWTNGSEIDETLNAMVIFPDDFEAELVDRLLDRLVNIAPSALQLIITRQPQRYVLPSQPQSATPLRFVMPRPTFGWLILDAIRAHLDSETRLEH
jgi:hypothetical protein